MSKSGKDPDDETGGRGDKSDRKAAKKIRKAASHPKRPGRECKAEPGAWEPVVNRSRCEGKADCQVVCPYDVFEIRRIDEAEYKTLPFLARIKLRVHGLKTSYTPRADQCQACGLCVVACPEKAITLRPRN